MKAANDKQQQQQQQRIRNPPLGAVLVDAANVIKFANLYPNAGEEAETKAGTRESAQRTKTVSTPTAIHQGGSAPLAHVQVLICREPRRLMTGRRARLASGGLLRGACAGEHTSLSTREKQVGLLASRARQANSQT